MLESTHMVVVEAKNVSPRRCWRMLTTRLFKIRETYRCGATSVLECRLCFATGDEEGVFDIRHVCVCGGRERRRELESGTLDFSPVTYQ